MVGLSLWFSEPDGSTGRDICPDDRPEEILQCKNSSLHTVSRMVNTACDRKFSLGVDVLDRVALSGADNDSLPVSPLLNGQKNQLSVLHIHT